MAQPVTAILDPEIDQLLTAVEAMCARLRRRAEPDGRGDMIPLKQAQFEFGRSISTLKRWADDEQLGSQPGGGNNPWLISRSAIIKVKRLMPIQNDDHA